MQNRKKNSTVLVYPDKHLTTVCEEVTEFNEELKELIETMKESMKEYEGVGLSANQVGVCKRIFVMETEEGETLTFVNPTIEEKNPTIIPTMEGCLSLPVVKAKLKIRSPAIIVEAYDVDGLPFKLALKGRDAVVAQHEENHLCGITLFDLMTGVQKKLSKERYLKLVKKARRASAR